MRDPHARLVYATGGLPPEPAAAEPAPRRSRRGSAVRTRLERRASGRLVTVVAGLPGTPREVAALASELKGACGAGGTVKDGVLELQGDQREKLEALLLARGLR